MKKITSLLLAALLPLALVSAQPFQLQNPQPTLDALLAIDFQDSQHGWAVGLAGDLIHTIDGGETWSVERIDSLNAWYALDFIDGQRGFVVGGHGVLDGVVARTTNGGQSWDFQPTPDPHPLANCVTFLNADNGWIAGRYGVISRTTDGGQSWEAQREPDNISFSAIAFASVLNGFAVGYDWVRESSALLRTSDGGATWLAGDTTFHLANTDIQFLDAATGFLLRYNGDVYDQNGEVLKTTDGGATWAVLADSVGRSAFDLAMADAVSGWIIDNDADVYHTSDGGVTWTRQTLPPADVLMSNYLQSLTALSPTEAWVGGFSGTLFHTTDAGLTWTSATRGCVDDIQDLCFIDSLSGWAVTSRTVLHSTDGGHAWIPQYSDSDFYSVEGIDFVSPLCGWAAGDGINGPGLLHTTDGGLTWSPQNGAADYSLQGIDFVSETTGWAVGLDRWMAAATLRTTDGGEHWTRYDIVQGDWLYGVAFANERCGWAFGDYSTLLHTTDGGDSWLPQLPFGQGALRGGCFVDSLTGWIVGDDDWNSRILHTTDGGLTWNRQDTAFTTGMLEDVYFADALHGWFVGEFGVVGQTTDGGATWQPASLPTLWEDLSAVCGVGGRVWVAGSHGAILRQDNPALAAVEPSLVAHPADYALAAFPNPFNPVTMLDLSLPLAGPVTLAVYDLMGRLVTTLWQGRLEAGRHALRFDASRLASGMYFARLTTPAYSTTQRLLLLK